MESGFSQPDNILKGIILNFLFKFTARMPMRPVEFSLTHYLPAACLPYRKTENFAMNYYDYNRKPRFFV